MSYRYSPKSSFKRRMPIRSFRDLGIYQTTEKISVEIVKNIIPHIPEESSLKKDLADCSMQIPHFIAEAHSRRFDDKAKAMKLLEEVLFLCNKVVVYLEQVRDIYSEEKPPPQSPPLSPKGTPLAPKGEILSLPKGDGNTPSDLRSATPLDGNTPSDLRSATPLEKGNYEVDRVSVDEIIKKYFYVRPKIFNFFKAWKRFDEVPSRPKEEKTTKNKDKRE